MKNYIVRVINILAIISASIVIGMSLMVENNPLLFVFIGLLLINVYFVKDATCEKESKK